MTRRLAPAEATLLELGVEQPEEIDLEAVAWHLGVQIRYRELRSCEARIVGRGDRAIISVDSRMPLRRQRFSIGHELGHWRHHRGRCLICRADDIGNRRRPFNDPERVADGYASDLLLPRYLLDPMVRAMARATLAALRALSDRFEASLTATVIKVMEADCHPLMLVCHGRRGRLWFAASPMVPTRWFPKDELDPESCAFAMLFGAAAEERFPRKIGADAWFDRSEAGAFEIQEQSYSLPGQQVATVLTFLHRGMLRE